MTVSFNLIRFNALASGLASFGVGAPDAGCVVPENAYVVNGKVYTYTARAAGNQYEYGSGIYDTATHTLARTTIYSSSNGNAKVNFAVAPLVDVHPSPQPALEQSSVVRPLQGHIFGLTLSTAGSSATFGIAAGECTSASGAALMTLPVAITKTTGAFVTGTGNGALDASTIAPSTWYHAFLIEKLGSGTSVASVDVLISTSLTPAMPTGYTLSRRIGSMKTNGSSQWTRFLQIGDDFIWYDFVTDLNNVVLPSTATSYTLTAPRDVPIELYLTCALTSTSGNDTAMLWSLYANAAAVIAGGSLNFFIGTAGLIDAKDFRILGNSALGGHIRAIFAGSGTPGFFVNVRGWKDMRGRLL